MNLTYGIDDVPPWYLCLFMALQVLFFTFIVIVYISDKHVRSNNKHKNG